MIVKSLEYIYDDLVRPTLREICQLFAPIESQDNTKCCQVLGHVLIDAISNGVIHILKQSANELVINHLERMIKGRNNL